MLFRSGKMDRVYKSIRVNLGISYLFNGVVLIVLYVFCEPLYHLFTTDQAVIDIGVYMLRFLVPSYLLSVLLENLTGGLRGLGDVLWPTIFTFAGLFFVRLPWTMIMTQLHHNVETLLISYQLPACVGDNDYLPDSILFLEKKEENVADCLTFK